MRLFALCLVVLAASGCALRPRYAEFITATTEGAERTFRLTDADTGAPLAKVKVELSENKTRLQRTTDADGTFTLPVDKKYVAENPVFVVALPAGVKGYVLSVVAPPSPTPTPAPEPAPAPTTPEPPAAEPAVAPAPAPSAAPEAPATAPAPAPKN